MRKIDHATVLTNDLEKSYIRFASLGFSVSAQGYHPFGTTNNCIFFNDQTYIELLASDDTLLMGRSSRQEATFLRRLQAYGFRHSQGFAMLAYKTTNAKADHQRFRNSGFDYGRMFVFGRTLSGKTDPDHPDITQKVAFKLAFAVDERSPDVTLFTCEAKNRQLLFSKRNTNHDNGVSGIAAVIMVEDNPSDFQYYLQCVLDERDNNADSIGMRFPRNGRECWVMTGNTFSQLTGLAVKTAGRGLSLAGLVLTINDLNKAETRWRNVGLKFIKHQLMTVVPSTSDQGINLIFVERW